MLTLPQPLDGQSVACSACSAPVGSRRGAVPLADAYFHKRCVPRCQFCGRRFSPELETSWSYLEHVVASPIGYERRPYGHICPVCREGGLLDEPCAQD